MIIYFAVSGDHGIEKNRLERIPQFLVSFWFKASLTALIQKKKEKNERIFLRKRHRCSETGGIPDMENQAILTQKYRPV